LRKIARNPKKNGEKLHILPRQFQKVLNRIFKISTASWKYLDGTTKLGPEVTEENSFGL
jgi:hypothetical protein